MRVNFKHEENNFEQTKKIIVEVLKVGNIK